MSDIKTKDYIEFRTQILDFVRRDLQGPYEESELIDESPASKYSTGIIFPQISLEVPDDGSLDTREQDDEEVGAIEQASSFYPSATGLSFAVSNGVNTINIKLRYGKYRKITAKDYGDVVVKVSGFEATYQGNLTVQSFFDLGDGYLTLKRPMEMHDRDTLLSMAEDNQQFKDVIYRAFKLCKSGWIRTQHEQDIKLSPDSDLKEQIIEGETLKLVLAVKNIPKSQKKICTISVVNTSKTTKPQSDSDKAYYQLHLALTLDNGRPFEDLNDKSFEESWFDDFEEESLHLLYHKRKLYGVGHGISVDWKTNTESDDAVEVYTTTLPSYIVPQMEFTLAGSSQKPDLSIATYAYKERGEIIDNLRLLTSSYSEWIEAIEQESKALPSNLQNIAAKHVEKCKDSLTRMLNGIEIVSKNDDVFRAFQHANEAMLMQRSHTRLQNTKSFADENVSMPESYRNEKDEWRPFQIAFIIMNLVSMSDTDSSERDIVDLIWFPTGGGKTEAYLGLTAFTIFFRRIKYKDRAGGTTVIMRYTLRLLTSQQFQRACTLICACENIRKSTSLYGDEPITVGLWLGSASTPNTLEDAKYRVGELHRGGSQAENPFQVIDCPWCGTHMTKVDRRGIFCYEIKSRPKQFYMWCPNGNCTFSDKQGGLPIIVVDDDIYNRPPTLLFGTVDKFAMLPWKKEASSLFALNNGNQNISPSLIIQDELHLISGSLGTVVGLYETAIDILCSAKSIKPKIIASTATIRKAQEQCKSLYARDVAQFPSPGIDASDSFFAREAPVDDNTPGRLYVGVMPSGKTSTTMQVRLMADVIQGVEILDTDDAVKDTYWTQVVYCNSIRELGSSKSIVFDDVKEYSKSLAKYYGKKPRFYGDRNVQELTSRISAENIPEILRMLENSYPSKDAVDVLLATNMISVGVDINRFGIMTVLGQPKTTSEYIQASSRVGRKNPGLVLTLYSPVKSRDRSHYEQFLRYHQSLYRFVEPTSVTPFSAPVRDKALHAVVIILIRHYLGLHDSEDLESIDINSPEVRQVVGLILDRTRIVDSVEANSTDEEINKILARIDELKRETAGITYGTQSHVKSATDKLPLMRPAQDKKGLGEYPTLQSMRSTDSECYVTLDHS